MNAIVPMPIPIPQSSCGGGPKVFIACIIALFIIAAVTYVGGYIYEGLKHKEWTLSSVSKKRYLYLNYAKMLGGVSMLIVLIIAVIGAVTELILQYL